jgi:glycosyltransferase involved in cell wall biosynthesis
MLLKSKPLVSVVLPTFNSEKFLESCLRSIRSQTYGNIEIVVVDNFSTDKTREIAENYGGRIIAVKAKRSEARNVGAENSSGDFVFFVDSDMELDSRVVSECIERIGEGYDAVIVPEISVGEGFWARCKALEKACYIGDSIMEAARFFRRSIFRKEGGYDPGLDAGEDWDLSNRIRRSDFRIGRTDAPIVHHEGRLTLRQTMLKKHFYGKTLKQYQSKNPKEASQQLTPIRSSLIKKWRKLARSPVCACGLLLMKSCEFLATKLAY